MERDDQGGQDPAVVEAQRRQEEKRLADLATERGFATIAEAFITGKVSKERRGKEVEREIRREFIAAWGAKPISEITRSDVRAIIEKKAATAPHQARNLLGIVKRLFTWVVESERYGIEYSPCDRLRPTALGIDDKVPRQRALKDHELAAFWRATERIGYPAGPVYQLLALLALRRNEVARAEWCEFHPELRRLLRERKDGECIDWAKVDSSVKVWVIPASRMKGKNGKAQAHAVPLPDAALRVLEGLPMFSGDYLFSTSKGARPVLMSHRIKLRMDDLMGFPDWRTHDLRRTVRSGLSQLRIEEHVRERVLAHVQGGVKAVYDTHDYLAEKADALLQWAARLGAIVDPVPRDNVVPMARPAVGA